MMRVWRRRRRAVWAVMVVMLVVTFFSFQTLEDVNQGNVRRPRTNDHDNTVVEAATKLKLPVTGPNSKQSSMKAKISFLHLSKSETPTKIYNLNDTRYIKQNQLTKLKSRSVHHRSSKVTPKVYIYPLPDKFNRDIMRCASSRYGCMKLGNGGLGTLQYDDGELRIFRTNQFSLEIVLHNQLLHSKYRTDNPDQADVFYIPGYLGTQFFCNHTAVVPLINGVFNEIQRLPYFRQGKPHISTLAKIEKELAHKTFPVLANPLCRNVTYFLIEKETHVHYRNQLGLRDQPVIVAPYPSYGHLNAKVSTGQSIVSPSLESRDVFMLLAASDRRTNTFRNSLLDQMVVRVKDTSFQAVVNANGKIPESTWLETKECTLIHENITIDWMKHSVFCLQPHGDSPTRKSFYDSIVSGCIPVIFRFSYENVVYPFQRVLNYSDFVVSIDGARVENGERVLTILKGITRDTIQRLHNNVLKVARQLQYSYIDDTKDNTDSPYVDALDMLMDEVAHSFNL